MRIHLVQPILVPAGYSHEDTVKAVAKASLGAYLDNPYANWDKWLVSSFAKSVRRFKETPATLSKIDECYNLTSGYSSGEVTAFAGPPMMQGDFPTVIRRAQVSGTDSDDKPIHDYQTVINMLNSSPFLLVVNADMGMSTGKEAAQVAHAYWMAFLTVQGKLVSRAYVTNDSGTRVFADPVIARVPQDVFDHLKSSASVVVKDNGLTEVPQGTETVLVLGI